MLCIRGCLVFFSLLTMQSMQISSEECSRLCLYPCHTTLLVSSVLPRKVDWIIGAQQDPSCLGDLCDDRGFFFKQSFFCHFLVWTGFRRLGKPSGDVPNPRFCLPNKRRGLPVNYNFFQLEPRFSVDHCGMA